MAGQTAAALMSCSLPSSARACVSASTPNFDALYVPLPWPSGIQTRPEVDQELAGTKPVDFAADLAEQETLLEFVSTRPGGADWPRHPIFGRMSEANWLRWAYLHSDHHLRQFGV